MEQSTLSEEQKQALEDSLSRGQAFEELIRTKGWEYIRSWYQGKVQLFANALLLQDNKTIEEFENERRELIGIRKILGLIESDIKTLRDSVEKEKKGGKK